MIDELEPLPLGISIVAVLIMAAFFFRDPLGAGMDMIPTGFKIITLVLGVPVFYFVAWKILD